ncbi:hypothetical protein NCLIV_056870 [Neospora caninum Liverpool]|uniref:FPL domain-containing protein n=1 Tax=Neospora caninum (strain Liverpool) TaxID=572307 RepID=F0VNG7_NEOCL|nr:hypothetical protein NCLIV_056870 [Neospora caninum Liverpool]CBZ55263.1 hypothetical protein NCLIV_056870 [Neospora caninum Liverpool]|eukprot:XP_003885291.1 hypothetical protein NCLIV_056870 [Neospora caninum Liverpool]
MWFWGGGSGGFSTGALKDAGSHHGSSKHDFYTEGHLQDLFDSLHAFETIDDRNRDAAVEILRQIAELLAWGERHKNEAFFDIFCEQNILSYFVDIVSQPRVANAVKVQLLQTLSILVQNTHRKTAVYYLFSNNYLNTLLSTTYDFSNEEVVAWYVSFIKGLSLLVNHDTVKLFLNRRAPSFPVFSEAVKFFIHRDSMVRTHVRTVTLSIFKIREPIVEEFIVKRSAFFSHIACYLRVQWAERCRSLRACRRRSSSGSLRPHLSPRNPASSPGASRSAAGTTNTAWTASSLSSLRSGFAECEEFLYYIQDIFGIGVEAYNAILVERLLLYTYLPVLVGCLCRATPPVATVRRFAFPDGQPTSTVSTPGGGDRARGNGGCCPSSLARRLLRRDGATDPSSRDLRRRSDGREAHDSQTSWPLPFPSTRHPRTPPSSSSVLPQTPSPSTCRPRPRRKDPRQSPSSPSSPPSSSSSLSSSAPSSSPSSCPSSVLASFSKRSRQRGRDERLASREFSRSRHRDSSTSRSRRSTTLDADGKEPLYSPKGGEKTHRHRLRKAPSSRTDKQVSATDPSMSQGPGQKPSERETSQAASEDEEPRERRGDGCEKITSETRQQAEARGAEGQSQRGLDNLDRHGDSRFVEQEEGRHRKRRADAKLEVTTTSLIGKGRKREDRNDSGQPAEAGESPECVEQDAGRDGETLERERGTANETRGRGGLREEKETESSGLPSSAEERRRESVDAPRDASRAASSSVESRRAQKKQQERRSPRDESGERLEGSLPFSFASYASPGRACKSGRESVGSGPDAPGDDTQQLVALYLLTQSFQTIQNPDLLRPVLALLLLPRVPASLLRLCSSQSPATPATYVALENPAQCAGRVDLFLPEDEACGEAERAGETEAREREVELGRRGDPGGRGGRRGSAEDEGNGSRRDGMGAESQLGSAWTATEGKQTQGREDSGGSRKGATARAEEGLEPSHDKQGETSQTPTLTDAEHEEFQDPSGSRSASASRPPLFASFSFQRGGSLSTGRQTPEGGREGEGLLAQSLSRRDDAGASRRASCFFFSSPPTKPRKTASLSSLRASRAFGFMQACSGRGAAGAGRQRRAEDGDDAPEGSRRSGPSFAEEAGNDQGDDRNEGSGSCPRLQSPFGASESEREDFTASFPSAASIDAATSQSLSSAALIASRRPVLQLAQKQIQRAFEEHVCFPSSGDEAPCASGAGRRRRPRGRERPARETVSAVWGVPREKTGDREEANAATEDPQQARRERRQGGPRREQFAGNGLAREDSDDTAWVANPYRRSLEQFVGADSALRRRDTAILLGGTLLHAVLSHPAVTSFLSRFAGLLAKCRSAAFSAPNEKSKRVSACSLLLGCFSSSASVSLAVPGSSHERALHAPTDCCSDGSSAFLAFVLPPVSPGVQIQHRRGAHCPDGD